MRMNWRDARALTAALAVGACVSAGCSGTGTTRPPTGAMPNTAPTLQLSAEQDRRARAVAHFAAGMAMEKTDDTDAGLAEFQKSLELDPHNPQLALHVAQIYLNRRDSTNAIAILESATRTDPASPVGKW